MRAQWTGLTDAQLLGQCEVDTYRASGPGGQKRNKTSSAVRLRHGPSGLIVIAEESRSQHENKARALRRLRQAIYLKIREPIVRELGASAEVALVLTSKGSVGQRDPRYWEAVGVVLDVLQATEGRVSDAATILEVSTARLVDFLASNDKAFEQANILRTQFGQKPLRA